MTENTPHAARLAQEVCAQLDWIAEDLTQAAPEQAAKILAPVLDAEDGILGRLAALLAAASHYIGDRAADSTPARAVWEGLAHAADTLYDVALDLEDLEQEFALLPAAPGGTAGHARSGATPVPPPPRASAGIRPERAGGHSERSR
ncbi:hypothetical protein [Streptomyces sp. YIM 98790]|uniref:hypothetical protein n=1 Tax=Streptomyces sp. YIM 98790 TaxID=2689077 RepID=UPI00140B1360|nr:hypothetical protein [Streptomyces sp. YIM 98790]